MLTRSSCLAGGLLTLLILRTRSTTLPLFMLMKEANLPERCLPAGAIIHVPDAGWKSRLSRCVHRGVETPLVTARA